MGQSTSAGWGNTVSAPTTERSGGVRGVVSTSLFRLTRYVQLEPNVGGLGVNLSNLIDDLHER